MTSQCISEWSYIPKNKNSWNGIAHRKVGFGTLGAVCSRINVQHRVPNLGTGHAKSADALFI